MASTRRNSASRSALKGWTALLLGTLLAAALVGGLGHFGPQTPSREPPSAADYSGSIVISSPNSQRCRHYQLDNSTGGIKYNSKDDCTEAHQSRDDRASAVLNGFRNR